VTSSSLVVVLNNIDLIAGGYDFLISTWISACQLSNCFCLAVGGGRFKAGFEADLALLLILFYFFKFYRKCYDGQAPWWTTMTTIDCCEGE
jgi:hypothetical protein